MMITEKLLSERYRFKEDYVPYQLLQSQKDARKLFLDNIHKKNEYVIMTECPYCNNNSFIKISEIERRWLPSEIVICKSCDGCFKLNVMSLRANEYHYEKISYILRGKEISDDAIEMLFWKRVKSYAYPRFNFILSFIELKPERDLVAEFGCNDGANLYPWHERGFNALGIELDNEMVEFGKRKGLNLIYGDLLDYNFSEKNPGLIILSHVLEHVRDCNGVLEKLHEVLKPDGCLFIEVPGIKSHGLRNPLLYFDVEHNYYFDLNSLSKLLKRHAFKLIYADEYVRVLCTPNQEKSIIKASKKVPVSLKRIIASVLKKFVDVLSFKREDLYDLLKKGEGNSFRIRILNKIQAMYFHYYYSYICVSNEKK